MDLKYQNAHQSFSNPPQLPLMTSPTTAPNPNPYQKEDAAARRGAEVKLKVHLVTI